MGNSSSFQEWMDSKGYTDVRFYPLNTEESSTVDILDSALHSVTEYEQGKGARYTDDIETYF
ncbi:hypothetical protein BTHERMOSOX_845 [Bathymodiolus thermophilus thioautotrophic gill symbiont]|uniref:Uncharacterized protein n=1 Tax=Bathymodiolus thermophilus thioautotrophic gill symbiont TaxID=2360 RepID=A0A1J5UF41_9GAMM|nr:hypothetical protein [Bathymodiolus thermophilus thioautotrophic gill symbiont]OIR24525.1 hypothetical protein BGC33_10880 [Bathymodiolus thermophilus thioautotrophic gill symbiont]CAB5493871.1 hypothetical protein THERMOS_6 [Bathymodiolus thermophilus thioautotrophic gill symbiont]SHA01833.1 hypothetical protein BTHERMOSOX_845 [Bathymodiolus thermophilus thioautotrophic gill symbiont]